MPNMAGSQRSSGPRSRRGARQDQPSRNAGQTLVEFALVVPLFLLLLMAFLEFGFEFNALLAINFASRDGALTAAEAGNDGGADCAILRSLDAEVRAPADPGQIQTVKIYWTDALGNVLTPGGAVGGGGLSNIGNAFTTYVRAGSMTCTVDGATFTLPYSATAQNKYPSSNRCNVLVGCVDGNGTTHPGLDTIGVQITYRHTWKTGFPLVFAQPASGILLSQSNAMGMEPVR